MSLIDQFRELGLIAQLSADEELVEHLQQACRTVYCGFDPTADSLHIGNLVPLLALRRFQLAGHRPLLLVGGATGMIGDPGGRDSERELQTADAVERQLARIRQQAEQFLDFNSGESSAIVVNNMDWTRDLSVIDYLREIGKHFSVNAMIQKESVRKRIEDPTKGISYTEFSYQILQAYDFAVLHRDYGCTIQMGGSDQWGNITAGIDLIRRMHGEQAYAVTYPLITKSDGTKFGKSSGGAIWLDPAMTSPFSFYQFWINTDDADVLKYLKIFTFLEQDRLAGLASDHANDPGSRVAHRELAREVTRLVHGEDGLAAAERITQAMFANRIGDLGEGDLAQLAQDGMPSSVSASETPLLVDALVESGLAVTPRGDVTVGQARKLIQGNAVAVNGEKIADTEFRLVRENALHGKYFVLQKGKKNHHLVCLP
ncbi:MAG: tyrosine--tRNA ligase [Proteobacteria bacterium]|nr:tyrosine--tRNA ligase [Pseudomonadota bacterium]